MVGKMKSLFAAQTHHTAPYHTIPHHTLPYHTYDIVLYRTVLDRTVYRAKRDVLGTQTCRYFWVSTDSTIEKFL